MESRHVSIWIEAAPEVVYEFAADPHGWRQWAAGLAEGGLRRTADGWVADSPMGEVTVEFAPPNEFGVLDKSDLVMIDPVGTGLSHAVCDHRDDEFWGVDPDIDSVSPSLRST